LNDGTFGKGLVHGAMGRKLNDHVPVLSIPYELHGLKSLRMVARDDGAILRCSHINQILEILVANLALLIAQAPKASDISEIRIRKSVRK
jgi:hypothetical protein